MLAIKLSRKGKKNQPFFRVIILEKTKDPWGDFLEDLGLVDPLHKKISLKVERIKYWLSQGAQPTASVHNLLVNQKVIEAPKMRVSRKHKEIKKEEAVEPKKELAKTK